ncbi:7864_t:CDS:2, partial [Scutellospora calospora]
MRYVDSREYTVINYFKGNNNETKRKNLKSGFINVVDILGENPFIDPQYHIQNNLDYFFIDNNYFHNCQKIKTYFHRFDNPLVVCTLDFARWRLKNELLDNNQIQKEINDVLTNVCTISEWNRLKLHIKFIFRSYPKPFKFLKKNSVTIDSKLSILNTDLDQLESDVLNELIETG